MPLEREGAWGELGRDFWLYRLGQSISTIGDVCRGIALSWWVLEKTGSAAQLAAILSPSMLVSALSLPLLGPIGDRYPRKHIIVIGDAWRAAVSLLLAAMVLYDLFNIGLLVILYIMSGIGTALFRVGASGIVPQIVTTASLPKAVRQSQVMQSVGLVVGGAIGGGSVTLLGVGGAFLVDGLSFFIAISATLLITADTRPEGSVRKEGHPIAAWAAEVKEGFIVFSRIPVLFWLSMVAVLLNFAYAPMGLALPVFAKQIRGMPPWFLGALNSSASCGLILASLSLGPICRKMRSDLVIVLGLLAVGGGMAVLTQAPGVLPPLAVMFLMGAGIACCDIPINTQNALALPDRFRSRVSSISGFMGQSAAPIGTAVGGILLAGWGMGAAMGLCGAIVAASALMLFAVPKFSEFYRLPPDKAAVFFRENYPAAFK